MQLTKTIFHVYTTHHLYKKIREVIDGLIAKNPGIQFVLDVPAGSGALTHYIATTHGMKIRASDIDRKKWAYKQIKLDVADLGRRLPYKDEAFDLTICLEGLKHVTDLATALSEISRVTREDGFVVLTIPNDLNMQNRLRFLLDGFVDSDWKIIERDAPDVQNYLYVQTLIHLPYLYFHLEKNNLRIVDACTSRFRPLSVFLGILLFPVLYYRTLKVCGRSHPLFRQLISFVWLSGRHNIIVCQKRDAQNTRS